MGEPSKGWSLPLRSGFLGYGHGFWLFLGGSGARGVSSLPHRKEERSLRTCSSWLLGNIRAEMTCVFLGASDECRLCQAVLPPRREAG
jgi:hypothetical protein